MYDGAPAHAPWRQKHSLQCSSHTFCSAHSPKPAGASEKTLKRLSIPYRKVYIHAGHHAGYYPGAKTIDLKLLFSPEVGCVILLIVNLCDAIELLSAAVQQHALGACMQGIQLT
jgi:hypothetical protein